MQLHDSQTKEWLKVRPIPASAFKDGQYVLVNCGTAWRHSREISSC